MQDKDCREEIISGYLVLALTSSDYGEKDHGQILVFSSVR